MDFPKVNNLKEMTRTEAFAVKSLMIATADQHNATLQALGKEIDRTFNIVGHGEEFASVGLDWHEDCLKRMRGWLADPNSPWLKEDEVGDEDEDIGEVWSEMERHIDEFGVSIKPMGQQNRRA